MTVGGIYMTKRTVKDLDVAGKKVIVRCDFNVPRKDGVITDDNRIVMALPTIKYLVENKARVILMSHLGKVKTEEDKAKNNLECVAVRLQELLPDVKVTFCPVTRGEELENAVNALADGEIVLMQNTRYEKGESKNDPELGAYWASLGEVFVEDAFGSVHRAHASTVGIPTNIKENGLGFLVEKEVTMLGKAVDEPAHPFVAIIGGSKVSSKIDVVDNLLKKADKVIIGGGMAYTFSKAVGGSIGTSLVEDDKLDLALDIIAKAKAKGVNLVLGSDCVAADAFSNEAHTQVVPANNIPDGWEGLDAGPETQKAFAAAIEDAKTILWNGPAGVFEFDNFTAGSRAIAEAIAKATKNGAFSLIGGGDSVACINKFGLADQVSYISTGGGALLEAIEGKVLPGVAAIEK